jgi:membrane-associated phospholipid phosphatase
LRWRGPAPPRSSCCWGWADASDTARWLDASALTGATDLQDTRASGALRGLAGLGNPGAVALLAAALAAVALARGRPRLALLVLALLAATSVSSQVLKALLAYPRYDGEVGGAHVAPAAFPSGHATAAMSLAIGAVVVAPRAARPLAALLGGLLALAVSFSVMALGWHFPSDVVGGFLLATGWALVLVALLQAADARWPPRAARGRLAIAARRWVDASATLGLATAALAALLAGALALALVALTRLPELVGFAGRHTAFVLVAIAVTGAAMLLLAGVSAVLRSRG